MLYEERRKKEEFLKGGLAPNGTALLEMAEYEVFVGLTVKVAMDIELGTIYINSSHVLCISSK